MVNQNVFSHSWSVISKCHSQYDEMTLTLRNSDCRHFDPSRNSSQNKMSLIFWRNEILFGHFDKLVNAQVYKSRCCSFKALQLAMIYITVKASLYRKRIDHDDQDDHCTRISWTTSRHT